MKSRFSSNTCPCASKIFYILAIFHEYSTLMWRLKLEALSGAMPYVLITTVKNRNNLINLVNINRAESRVYSIVIVEENSEENPSCNVHTSMLLCRRFPGTAPLLTRGNKRTMIMTVFLVFHTTNNTQLWPKISCGQRTTLDLRR